MSLHDRYNRSVVYLRLSLTSACPMRCIYCRPAAVGHDAGMPELSASEIETLVRYLVRRHGLQKVRLTGGEPTSRPDLLEIIRRLAAIPGLHDLALTTNGLTLARQAQLMAAAGLHRVNISLDSLNAESFRRITGVNGLPHVLDGIDAALATSLMPVKLNCVVVRGENEQELPELLRFAASRRLEIRFIELMPMGPLARQWAQRYVAEDQMRARLESVVASWIPLARDRSAARRYRAVLRDGAIATVGFITAISCQFCADCNRIRVASNGEFYPCLMDRPAGNLLRALRPATDGEELDRVLEEGLMHKAPVHPAQGHAVMVQIGG